MSAAYRAVGWNRQKKVYDGVLAAGVGIYLAAFIGVGLALRPETTAETLLIRAFGTAALLLLHVTLAIGPLCRLDCRFLPLLYNRRHLGVATFVLGLAHGAFALVQFHALGDVHPLVSVLTAGSGWESLADLPFQPLGLAALAILFLMAATSHDFWLANLTAPVWKALHMGVYLAYGLIVLHVAFGVLQAETSPLLAGVLAAGFAGIVGLHLVAGWRERRGDRDVAAGSDGWVDAGPLARIPEGRARVVCAGGERIAVFRYGGKVSALSGVCQHQNGPLGEGKVLDGCVVCPWHGYQYRPEDGASPPPFTEKVPTFRVRVADGRAWVDPRPLPPGTRVEPATCEPGPADPEQLYVGYLPSAGPATAAFVRRSVAFALAGLGAVAVVLAAAQAPVAPGTFEFGVVRSFSGTLEGGAHPILVVAEPGGRDARHLLSAFGKHGADAVVAGFAGREVALEGSRVERGGTRMIEVRAGSVADAGAGAAPNDEVSLGVHTLVGEIVDSKCHLGVMKPGEGKPHRDCAVRCLSGGMPPLLLVRDAAGAEVRLLVVGRDGRAIGRELLDRVAEAVEVTGEVTRRGELLVLAAEPADFRRR